MAKVKYYYDENTLSYRKIKVKKSDRYRRIIFSSLAVILIAFIGFITFSQFIMSPKQRAQKRELENLRLHYELLSKRMEETASVLDQIQQRDNNIYRSYFEANPITEEQRKAGFGGVNRYKDLEGYDNSELIINLTKGVDILSKQLVVQSKSLDEIVSLAKDKENMLASIPAIIPIKKGEYFVASGYKMRMHPILKINKFHKGMDFSAPRGTPIYASGNGRVTMAERNSTYGNVVHIKHGYGYETIYAHMNKIATTSGKYVKRGDLIGYVGNTGLSVAPHLHYEVLKNGQVLNPLNFYYGDVTLEEFAALQKASEESQSLD
ncbi:MAG: M23 family metallopeptidase [Flavobacteriia bacterium]|nr:M23 family metallopeptidase [Flavobacteriia bacterium]OIP46988.1 MAG: peptidase M23 [Flavobacteriaceae bacterium CG2_30_31_66]PIV96597.1 MAG: peptidase M23 [Flavobacteriaceae bacterium CG17_big_fil_post_rev_8_21_14_2_50_31_13]PIX13974.1 MAG: peptidase M23 [Flavobacteriaceae bacterium CG_4_8_14_3_um_filter_31_8]PIY13883.1 MAG: peptidase M23 [Flavobacteriaceae bacterium CG_4_10_14_3_um_filter_31_253]PIZ10584.1 MAG: peptidase M23 [Flavobacteriaceae bacterium CG_4_10_14_0_8_um_filter_31_99]PJC